MWRMMPIRRGSAQPQLMARGSFSLNSFQGNHEESDEAVADLGEEAPSAGAAGPPPTLGSVGQERSSPQQLGDTAPSRSIGWFKVTGPKRLIDSAASVLCEAWRSRGECQDPFVKSSCSAICGSAQQKSAPPLL